MNAPAKTMSHPTHKFQLLLRREFWEHKGGFLWAPLVAGGIFLLLSMMGFGVGEMAARRATGNFQVGDGQVQFNGIDLGAFTSQMDAHDLYRRSEEHTSELQSLMRISYAVFCLKKKNIKSTTT